MLELKDRTAREEIGHRIAHAVQEVLGCLDGTQEAAPMLEHRTVELSLPMGELTEEHVREAEEAAEEWREKYEAEVAKLEADPSLKEQPRWYTEVTKCYRRMHWYLAVRERAEARRQEPFLPVTLHIVRLGDVAFATNPFEYYLDFGIYIKTRVPLCRPSWCNWPARAATSRASARSRAAVTARYPRATRSVPTAAGRSPIEPSRR
jgi:hypothetical protein